MTRTLDAAVNSYTSLPTIQFYTLAEFELDGGTLRVYNGAGYLNVGANTYSGIGDFGGMEPVKEDADSFPRGLRLWVSALNSASLYEAINEQLFNREVRVYRAWYNPSSLTVVNTAELWFRGKMNEVDLYRGDEDRGDYLEIMAEHKLRREAKSSYYTREDMLVGPYSGDTFFDHTSKIPGFKALWGQKATYFTPGTFFGVGPDVWARLFTRRGG